MRQQNNVTVHGGIHGRNNKIDNRSYQIKHIHNSGGGGKGGSGDNGFAIVIAIFAAIVTAAYIYLTNYELVLLLLKIGVILVGIFHFSAVVPLWRYYEMEYRELWPTILGLSLTLAQAWMVIMTMEALPPIVIEIANQPVAAKGLIAKAFEVWNRFNATGHRLIVENFTTVFLIALSIILNILLGLQNYFYLAARSEECSACEAASVWLYAAKIPGSVLSTIFAVGAYGVVSGIFSPHVT